MLKAYKKRVTTTFNEGGIISSHTDKVIMYNTLAKDNSICFTWDNIERYFKVERCKKGRKLTIRTYGDVVTYKEWRDKVIDFSRHITYEECNISLKEIFEYKDSQIACEYLKQMGIKLEELFK